MQYAACYLGHYVLRGALRPRHYVLSWALRPTFLGDTTSRTLRPTLDITSHSPWTLRPGGHCVLGITPLLGHYVPSAWRGFEYAITWRGVSTHLSSTLSVRGHLATSKYALQRLARLRIRCHLARAQYAIIEYVVSRW